MAELTVCQKAELLGENLVALKVPWTAVTMEDWMAELTVCQKAELSGQNLVALKVSWTAVTMGH